MDKFVKICKQSLQSMTTLRLIFSDSVLSNAKLTMMLHLVSEIGREK